MRRCLSIVAALTLLDTSSSAAAIHWARIQTVHFVVEGDAGDGQLRDVAARLEQFRVAIGKLFPSSAQTATGLPIPVVVFSSERAFEPYMPRYNGKAVKVAGYCLSRDGRPSIALLSERGDDGFAVVFHEYTHLIAHNLFQMIPVWFDEGYADFLGTFAPSGNMRSITFGRPIPSHIQTVRQGILPLTQLLAVEHTSPLYNEGDRRGLFYAESWALVHYLHMGRPDGPRQMAAYLNLLARGTAPDAAVTQAFHANASSLQSALKTYVDQRIFTGYELDLGEKLDRYKDLPVAKLGEADAKVALGDLLRQLDRPDDAAAHLERALSLSPDLRSAHRVMGLVRLEQNRIDEAWPSLERAATLDPADVYSQFALSTALLRYRWGDEAAMGRAREVLLKALVLSPNSPEMLYALAAARVARGIELADARADLERAIELSPGRQDYRLLLAQVAVQQSDVQTARAILGRLLALPRRKNDAIREDARAEMGRLMRIESARKDREALGLSKGDSAPADSNGPAADTGTAATDRPQPVNRFQPEFREVQAGEQRAIAVVQLIACGPEEVRFDVKLVDRSIRLRAKDLAAVEFITYREGLAGSVNCGKPPDWDAVYVTWKPRTDSASDVEGDLVAVEILPVDYVP